MQTCLCRWLCCMCPSGYVHVCGCSWKPEVDWASYSVTSHLIFGSRVSHWTWTSLVSLGCLVSGLLSSPRSPHPHCWDYGYTLHPAFYTGSGEPILGPHVGMAGNLPAEPSPRASFDGVASVLRYMMSGDVPSALQVDVVLTQGSLKHLCGS